MQSGTRHPPGQPSTASVRQYHYEMSASPTKPRDTSNTAPTRPPKARTCVIVRCIHCARTNPYRLIDEQCPKQLGHAWAVPNKWIHCNLFKHGFHFALLLSVTPIAMHLRLPGTQAFGYQCLTIFPPATDENVEYGEQEA